MYWLSNKLAEDDETGLGCSHKSCSFEKEPCSQNVKRVKDRIKLHHATELGGKQQWIYKGMGEKERRKMLQRNF